MADTNEMKDIVKTLRLIALAGATTPDFKNNIFGNEAPRKMYYSIIAQLLVTLQVTIVFAIDQDPRACKYFIPKDGDGNIVDPYNLE